MRIRSGTLLLAAWGLAGCKPSDVLSVPPPSGVTSSTALQSQAGAEAAFRGAKGQLFAAYGDIFYGTTLWSELMSDEYTQSGFSFGAGYDARFTAVPSGSNELYSDVGWGNTLQARSGLLLAVPLLTQYEPASSRQTIGEAYALIGYSEIMLAETFCAGTPLDHALPGGQYAYGTPLTTDSMLGAAVVHFDSAIANANGDPTVTGLARVGLGRALLGRAQYAAADTIVASVPTGFVYNVSLVAAANIFPPNGTFVAAAMGEPFYRMFNVADHEGGAGLNYASANDPRLTLDTTLTAGDGGPWILATKFENDLTDIAFSTGVEARLIQAEAAQQAGDPSWVTDLSDLRADNADTHITFDPTVSEVPLLADSTTSLAAPAQVDFLFRERAFWLFGTGIRLGDMRRLLRQYGRDQSTVYPTGPYDATHPLVGAGIPSYGADVSITLPTAAGLISNQITVSNPAYKGCLTSTATP
jgi:hypothetical protein